MRNRGLTREVRLLIGMCLVLRREVLDELGLLDEKLFVGCDDLELSWRLRTHGYQLRLALDVFVHHKGQVSFKSLVEGNGRRLLDESTNVLHANLEKEYGFLPRGSDLWGLNIAGSS
jgi:GT2 family glycosyltransferase